MRARALLSLLTAILAVTYTSAEKSKFCKSTLLTLHFTSLCTFTVIYSVRATSIAEFAGPNGGAKFECVNSHLENTKCAFYNV